MIIKHGDAQIVNVISDEDIDADKTEKVLKAAKENVEDKDKEKTEDSDKAN